jgi:arylsulfatase A-like enzyme
MRLAGSFCACLALALAACGGGPEAPRSIVLVSIDTLRADHVGAYGYGRATTPFLDRMASEGILFERAFTSAAWTLIAHMTMLTGLYPEQHGVVEGDQSLDPRVPLLAERLRLAGYQTLGLYRPGWVHPRHGFERGFDVFRTHMSVEEAEAHLFEELPRLSSERPTFLFLHLFDVHNDPSTKEPPSVFSAPPPYQDLFLPGAHERLAGETYLSIKKRKLAEDEREALVSLYDDGVRHVDAALERIFARLAAEGRFQDALVIFTSDHGESLAQRENYGHGGPWQEGLHVPLILRLPDRARAGEKVHEVAHLVDVNATVLDYAGLAPDPLLPGRSLLGQLPPERIVLGGNDPIEFAVRWPDKLVRFGKRVGSFDLGADPGELEARESTAAAFEALRSAADLPPATIHRPVPIGPMSEAERAALDALGYGGEAEGTGK